MIDLTSVKAHGIPSALSLLLALIFPLSASANPVPDWIGDQMNSLPFAVLQRATPGDSAQFVHWLAEYGLDEPFLYRRPARVLIDSNFRRFKPYMLASQVPGRGLDPGIQARFRSRGDASDRTAMCRALRSWLSAPTETLSQAVRVYMFHDTAAMRAGRLRARAAELLVAWRDTSALPEIRRLSRSTSLDEESRQSLKRSAARLERPCADGFLVPDGVGGLESCRTFADVVNIRIVPDYRARAECSLPLDGLQQRHLWDLLVASREGQHARWFESDGRMEIVFRDSLKATIQVNEAMEFDYTDTGHPGWWSRTLENRALYEALKECLPRRELTRNLGYGSE